MSAQRVQPADDERFLQLVVCAGAKDRFRAMNLRRLDGLRAAIAYLEDCPVTNEGQQADNAHLVRKVRESLAQIKTIAALLSGADPNEVDQEAALKLIEAQAECATLRLEQLERGLRA